MGKMETNTIFTACGSRGFVSNRQERGNDHTNSGLRFKVLRAYVVGK